MTTAKTKKPTLLVLIPKGMGEADAKENVETVLVSLKTDLNLDSCNLVDSKSWFHEHFSACGNWESWIWSTVTGKAYGASSSYFDGFVVCSTRLGRANAQIVNLALRSDRLVLFWSKDTALQVVTSVVTYNHESWSDGWGVTCTSLGD